MGLDWVELAWGGVSLRGGAKVMLRKRCGGRVGAELYLAVGDGVKHLADLLWSQDFVFFRGQRVGRSQSIHCEHSVDIVQYDQVFLMREKENVK